MRSSIKHQIFIFLIIIGCSDAIMAHTEKKKNIIKYKQSQKKPRALSKKQGKSANHNLYLKQIKINKKTTLPHYKIKIKKTGKKGKIAKSKKCCKKTVFITGTDTGIGNATVRKFASEGWNVIATVLKQENINLFSKYPNVITYQLDVSNNNQILNITKKVIEKFKKIDVIVNNAGYLQIGPLESTSIEKFSKLIDVNFMGTVRVCKAFIPHMRGNRDGIIINVASDYAVNAICFFSAYSSSKMAMIGLSEALSSELEEFGIRVKIIHPGFHKTKIFTKGKADIGKGEGYQYYKKSLDNLNKAFKILPASPPENCACDIFQAATDNTNRLKYYSGPDIKLRIAFKRLFGEKAYINSLKNVTKNRWKWPKIYASLYKGEPSESEFDF